METVTVTLDKMAHGGKALGSIGNKSIFVAGALPGEKVRAQIFKQGRVLDASLVEVVHASPDRIPPRCQPSDIMLADFQHVSHAAQLRYKAEIVRDQFKRLGKLQDVPLGEIRPNPNPWQYRRDTILSPTPDGGPGYWSRMAGKVVPAQACAVLTPTLQSIVDDIDLDLTDLIKLIVRVGSDGSGQLVFAMEDAEPPEISADFPISVALVMPDGIAATLIGDPFVDQFIKGFNFRVGAGSHFQPSLEGAELLIDSVLELAELTGSERVIDCFCGVGVLTRSLAENSAEVIGIERNEAAVEDFAVNLDDLDNVAVYNDWAEDALPALDLDADLIVLDTDGYTLPDDVGNALLVKRPSRIIYSSPNLSSAAKDAEKLSGAGYKLAKLQAVDTLPQTHQIHTVGLWTRT